MRPAGWSPTLRRWTNHALPRHSTSRPAGWSPMRPAGWSHTAPLAWWRQRARPSRPPERNWEAMATRWKRRWNRRHPPTLTKGTCRETPPNPPNRAESAPARRPTASARPLTAQLPSPPTWELPPSLPHPPVWPKPTYLPSPPTHSRRCTGLRAGARVSKRAPATGSSFRSHAGTEYS